MRHFLKLLFVVAKVKARTEALTRSHTATASKQSMEPIKLEGFFGGNPNSIP